MDALANVLSVATHAEVVDPLNGAWGAGLEMHRDAGLPQWLYAVLRHNCSVLLLMTPGGKVRQNAMEQLDKVAFDPPHMLDDIFLLGFNYIKVQKASDYANVFQIRYFPVEKKWVAVISAKNRKRQRRKRQSVTAKREKSQTPKVLTAILPLPYLT